MKAAARAELWIAVSVVSASCVLLVAAVYEAEGRRRDGEGQVALTRALALALDPLPSDADADGRSRLFARLGAEVGAELVLLSPAGEVLASATGRAEHPALPLGLAEGGGIHHSSIALGTTQGPARLCVERPVSGSARVHLIVLALLAVSVLANVLATSSYVGRTLAALMARARRFDPRTRPAIVALPSGVAAEELAGEDALERILIETVGQKDQLEVAIEALEEGVLALDQDQRVTLMNRAARELLGAGDGAPGTTLAELSTSAVLRSLVGAASAGESGSVELELREGARAFAVAKPLGEGRVALVLKDVTQVVRLQKIRRDFVANVSHELRTPISIILANSETLIDGAIDDPPAALRFLDAIHRNAARLSRLVSDLLDLSRLESGRFSLHLEEIPLEAAIHRVAEELAGSAAEKGLQIHEPVGEHFVRADANALEQIVVNLLDNAIKYSSSGGHVEIRVLERGEAIRVEIEDDGPGIEAKHRARLFERFYRVDKGRSREAGGTGLGLSIVKHLVEAMGGDVGMSPGADRGSIFWFTLRPTRSVRERGTSGVSP